MKTPETREERYQRLHAEGARKYGKEWLDANKAVSYVARNNGLDAREHKFLLTDMAELLCSREAIHRSVVNHAIDKYGLEPREAR